MGRLEDKAALATGSSRGRGSAGVRPASTAGDRTPAEVLTPKGGDE